MLIAAAAPRLGEHVVHIGAGVGYYTAILAQMAGGGGRRPGSGRKKGVPNKLTADVKAAIIAAFSDVGGPEYLRKIARTHPQVFCSLLSKVRTGSSMLLIKPQSLAMPSSRAMMLFVTERSSCRTSGPNAMVPSGRPHASTLPER